MAILEPYVDNILFETAVPIIIVSNNDDYQFNEEPIEFIKRLHMYHESLFSYKSCMEDLVSQICTYKMYKNDTEPVHLKKCIDFCMSNLHQY